MTNEQLYNLGWNAQVAGCEICVEWHRMIKIGWHNANGTKYTGGP